MVPIVGYHVTRTACRESIQQNGLFPSRPTKARPFGVYVFREDDSFLHVTRNSNAYWLAARGQDLWECTYIGPIMIDEYVFNALIFLGPVEHVTLVTGNEA